MASSGTAKITLPADDQILITREFAAPRRLVYRAWTTPELVKRWWGGHRGTVTSVEIDLRVGGRWRYVLAAGHGQEVAFHGEYREIAEAERIVNTEVFEMPGAPESDEGAPVVTTTFTEHDGRTTVAMLSECGSRELRDGILESGMETGMQEQFDLLEELAQSLR
ncbi:SRPBCC family protein [Amycolatopsis acidicola]|uniref:SRPBCC family protein n=1 Tax=Amycolatopsis acidicola TaxID=2596893 RepID=A0A5N0V1N6_9PSEU|nr:SRPBCC family protein [Amycolatopsis acidicola]KAA9159600.1 SRPBCC family protein [Amycolatopsis acidicola]